jgi:thermitase
MKLIKLSSAWATQAGRLSRYLVAWLLLFTLLASFASPAKAADNLWGSTDARFKPGSFKPGEVVVKFREPTSGKRVNNLDIQPDHLMTSSVVQPYGLTSYKALFNMPGYFQYFADSKADMQKLVAALSLDPQVEFAEPNYIVKLDRGTSDPRYNETPDPLGTSPQRQWYLKKIGIESAWDITVSSNVVQVVAVLDTGVNPFHEDLLGKVVQDRAYDFIRNKYIVANTMSDDAVWDDYGHGTAVAGIIAAKSNNKIGIAGINWNWLILPVKVLNANGEGTTVTVGQGITYAADNQARIINLSLGNEENSKILEGAVQYAQKKGVLIVAAAGNTPDAKPGYPAAYPNVIAVAATDINDKITSFSSYGPYISVAAPGKEIYSTYCDFLSYTPATSSTAPASDFYNTDDNRVYKYVATSTTASPYRPDCINPDPARYPTPPVVCNNNDYLSCYYAPKVLPGDTSGTNVITSRTYVYMDGTSFAAPIVTGLASLVIQVRPDIANEQIKTLIEGTAVDINTAGRDNLSGYGRVNAAALIQAANSSNISGGRNSAVQGIVTGANFPDVIVNLDPPNQNQNLTSSGGYRFNGLGMGVYYLRLSVPKRGIVLGPVAVYPNGRYDNILNVNFDVASGTIICGEGTVCPGPQNSSPGEVPSQPIPPVTPLAANSAFFGPAAPLPGATYFTETSHNLSGNFRGYWQAHGGLAVFGFPISEEFQEQSATDGKT